MHLAEISVKLKHLRWEFTERKWTCYFQASVWAGRCRWFEIWSPKLPAPSATKDARTHLSPLLLINRLTRSAASWFLFGVLGLTVHPRAHCPPIFRFRSLHPCHLNSLAPKARLEFDPPLLFWLVVTPGKRIASLRACSDVAIILN